jgi:hypothetical protein
VSALRSALLIRALRTSTWTSAVRVLHSSRSALSVGLGGAKPDDRVAPLRETRAAARNCRLQLKEQASEQVAIGLEHAEPVGEFADLATLLRRKLRLPSSQTGLLGFERADPGSGVSHFR